jgi:hypothetical protein
VFIFRRLKRNHESHGFILDSGTVANSIHYQVEIFHDDIHYICANDNCSPIAACKFLSKISVFMGGVGYHFEISKNLVDSILKNVCQVVDNFIKGFACCLH